MFPPSYYPTGEIYTFWTKNLKRFNHILVRWVMGESSAKKMRGGGMEDVIFSGTDFRPGRNVAEVSLTLDNEARDAPACCPPCRA